MAANLDPLPADGSQRLVIRPQKSTLIGLGVLIGSCTLVGAGIMLSGRSLVQVVVWLGIGGLFIYGLYWWHLWVDSERVGVNRPSITTADGQSEVLTPSRGYLA